MAVTQQTIAAEAGVSTTTVSFVLTGRAEQMKVNPATARRVREVAARLGFRPNYHARSLAMGQSHTLGLVAGGDGTMLSHRYWMQIVGGIGARGAAARL